MTFQKNEYFLLDYKTYEDYLDTFITTADLRFINHKSACRKIVELGYRSSAAVYTQTQFEAIKEMLNENIHSTKNRAVLYGDNLESVDPVLVELAAREKPNVQKIISTIIFMTHRNKNGFEVSGFIDFDASLTRTNLQQPGCTDWLKVFQDKIKLRPKSDDLSFYDVHKGIVRHNDSDNYVIRHDVIHGLTFMHRGDHKNIFVDTTHGDIEHNYLRSSIFSPKYGYVILFDHILRKKI